MAFSLSPLHQDLLCPICYDIYKDPVILSCGHSFCRACLQRSWTLSSERECPFCRRRSSREHPPPDLALRNTCESYLQQKKKEEDSRSQAVLCSLHSEKLSMFCVYDKKLVCVQCVTENHQNHSFCSISKAATENKETVKSNLRTLEEKLKLFKNAKIVGDKVAAHIKSQFQQTEKQIQQEFEKFYQFLKTEEKARLFNLRKEEEEKSQNIKLTIDELDKHIKEICIRITETQNKLKNDALLMQDFKITVKRAQYDIPVPQPDSAALIDVAKHLGNLSYRVWEMMKNFLTFPNYPVVLDPNTANSSLSISADLSSVSLSTENPQLPDNPARMSGYKGVLGSEGFSSGTHSWVVEVGGSENWAIGVAEESVIRKVEFGAVPENGFYTIWRKDNKMIAGQNDSGEEAIAKLEVTRICVKFNWEEGQVTFFDNNTTIHTFKCTFKKKMYPYFYNTSKNPLKILPLRVSITAKI